eukprot:TRINITY_DN8326_c0_g1_i1.p1 TRINITY_DN8326_c0_g1~~TRINITY_DN8326_c0_g1_i1.p1  ORF type:complete len:674 (-),score=220.80 TRINITY_DN8326_c0_g1_i1:571-2592(-)
MSEETEESRQVRARRQRQIPRQQLAATPQPSQEPEDGAPPVDLSKLDSAEKRRWMRLQAKRANSAVFKAPMMPKQSARRREGSARNDVGDDTKVDSPAVPASEDNLNESHTRPIKGSVWENSNLRKESPHQVDPESERRQKRELERKRRAGRSNNDGQEDSLNDQSNSPQTLEPPKAEEVPRSTRVRRVTRPPTSSNESLPNSELPNPNPATPITSVIDSKPKEPESATQIEEAPTSRTIRTRRAPRASPIASSATEAEAPKDPRTRSVPKVSENPSESDAPRALRTRAAPQTSQSPDEPVAPTAPRTRAHRKLPAETKSDPTPISEPKPPEEKVSHPPPPPPAPKLPPPEIFEEKKSSPPEIIEPKNVAPPPPPKAPPKDFFEENNKPAPSKPTQTTEETFSSKTPSLKNSQTKDEGVDDLLQEMEDWWDENISTKMSTAQNEVLEFFESQGWGEYGKRLLEEGFDNLNDIEDDDLKDAGMKKGQIKKCRRLIKERFEATQNTVEAEERVQEDYDSEAQILSEWSLLESSPGEIVVQARLPYSTDSEWYITSAIQAYGLKNGRTELNVPEDHSLIDSVVTESGSIYFLENKKNPESNLIRKVWEETIVVLENDAEVKSEEMRQFFNGNDRLHIELKRAIEDLSRLEPFEGDYNSELEHVPLSTTPRIPSSGT